MQYVCVLQRPTASGDHPEAFAVQLHRGTPTVQLQPPMPLPQQALPVQLQQPMPLLQQALPVPLQPAMPQQAMMQAQDLESVIADREFYAQEYYGEYEWNFAQGN